MDGQGGHHAETQAHLALLTALTEISRDHNYALILSDEAVKHDVLFEGVRRLGIARRALVGPDT